MTKQMELHLVGTRHHVKAQTILEISNCCPMKVKLVREPKNEADPNAIAIYSDDDGTWAGMQLGYVSREVASELAPRLDKKQIQVKRAVLEELDASGHGPLVVDFIRKK